MNGPSLVQQLNWDDLTVQQRMLIINAICPECFPSDSRRILSEKTWAEIHPNTQTGLSRVQWEKVISGGVQ